MLPGAGAGCHPAFMLVAYVIVLEVLLSKRVMADGGWGLLLCWVLLLLTTVTASAWCVLMFWAGEEPSSPVVQYAVLVGLAGYLATAWRRMVRASWPHR